MNRLVVITGATGGLGPAIVRHFLKSGAQVAAVRFSTDEEEARNKLVEGLEGEDDSLPSRLHLYRADVTDKDSVSELFADVLDDHGAVDVLINVAGGYSRDTVREMSPEKWQHMLDLNLTSAFLCCHEGIPHMVRQNWGRVINVSSRAALKGSSSHAAYSASKAGVLRLTEALAEEVKDHGVTVNAVLPSVIDTPANREQMGAADFSRWVQPRSIAALMGFLVSEQAADITGAAIPVYGQA